MLFEAHFNIIPKAYVCVSPFKFCAFKLKKKKNFNDYMIRNRLCDFLVQNNLNLLLQEYRK